MNGWQISVCVAAGGLGLFLWALCRIAAQSDQRAADWEFPDTRDFAPTHPAGRQRLCPPPNPDDDPDFINSLRRRPR